MFEVGKKYINTEYHSVAKTCIAVANGGLRGWLYSTNPNTPITYDWDLHWNELAPEPKRWSTWQNVYEKHSVGASERLSRDSERIGVLIRHFEQHEGKEPVCVGVELEKV